MLEISLVSPHFPSLNFRTFVQYPWSRTRCSPPVAEVSTPDEDRGGFRALVNFTYHSCVCEGLAVSAAFLRIFFLEDATVTGVLGHIPGAGTAHTAPFYHQVTHTMECETQGRSNSSLSEVKECTMTQM